ncbi:hypothetical protein AMIS_20430 [Actinoplanes missouriensis 431]|uniref:Uncharacterized protein n=1 Tax=Actinoplanes missouriensis (strain ATCC 14538 / DSM 43046 / CBS 188.64 / JCM 3121 / NBRC 102363 / NCIMB 12654 / NRRL B-3342 / UNCC 431) TaxID=512565 RepID=I0H2M6_ACTM4|nr:hypothetical protein [Actinoplanes missouriensis]BAL87263.1 hypothetical protein AMIS_20430 [Actinoplanes missouriensis 431]
MTYDPTAVHWDNELLNESAPPADEPVPVTPERTAPVMRGVLTAAEADRIDNVREHFWKSRPILTHIQQFARARLVAPWATLGAVLAHVVAATPPRIQLPAIVGTEASLNLFIGLVGAAGAAKGASEKVAKQAVDLDQRVAPVYPLGSGEGIAHMFMRNVKGEIEMVNANAIVTIQEIDTLASLKGRQSSTIMPQLRQAAMGEQLGFFYVDETKRLMVPEHSYRLCLLAGIQPKRSGVLLNDDEIDGGTPQRFVWLSCDDPDAPDDDVEEPTPVVWQAPNWTELPFTGHGRNERKVMPICEAARETIIAARKARRRGDGDALDGHALLTREKVAAALAILDGRTSILDEDWELSGAVMAESDDQRGRCQRALQEVGRDQNRRTGEAEAQRTLVVEERVEAERLRRAVDRVRRYIRVAGNEGVSGAKLRGKLGALGSLMDQAVDVLEVAGEIRVEGIAYRGQSGHKYFSR